VRTSPHRRPNGWTDRDPNWHKYSVGQWAEVTGVGDRVCALMRSLPSQTCTYNHISVARSHGGAAVPREREARERARCARVQGWNRATHPPRARNASVGCAQRAQSTHSAKQTKELRNLRQIDVLERVIRRSRIFVQTPTDTGSSILYFSKMASVLCCVVQYMRTNG
jgi:hypothetical protein